jgi:hypothetical protein
MRARSDQDVITILPAAGILASDDDRAGLTSPGPTLHHTITGAAHEHVWGAAVVRLGQSSSVIRGLKREHRAGR